MFCYLRNPNKTQFLFFTAQVINGQPTVILFWLLHPRHLLSALVLYIGHNLQESPQVPISGYLISMVALFDKYLLFKYLFCSYVCSYEMEDGAGEGI